MARRAGLALAKWLSARMMTSNGSRYTALAVGDCLPRLGLRQPQQKGPSASSDRLAENDAQSRSELLTK
jgi:hypothetical protein